MKNGFKTATFRDRITELVETSGKSQSDIAADIGVSKQTLSAWITGQNSPRRPTVVALASYFGVTIPWLNGFDVAKYNDSIHDNTLHESYPSPDELQLLAAYHAADESIRSAVRKLLDI